MIKFKVGDIVKYDKTRRGNIIVALPNGSKLKERLITENSYTFVILCTSTHDHSKPPGKVIKVYTLETGKIRYYHPRNLVKA